MVRHKVTETAPPIDGSAVCPSSQQGRQDDTAAAAGL